MSNDASHLLKCQTSTSSTFRDYVSKEYGFQSRQHLRTEWFLSQCGAGASSIFSLADLSMGLDQPLESGKKVNSFLKTSLKKKKVEKMF